MGRLKHDTSISHLAWLLFKLNTVVMVTPAVNVSKSQPVGGVGLKRLAHQSIELGAVLLDASFVNIILEAGTVVAPSNLGLLLPGLFHLSQSLPLSSPHPSLLYHPLRLYLPMT